jgi:DNA-binding PadR family transcriptional regulator
MSANEIVLGLLIERPDTSYQLDKRLEQGFPSARFSRDTARQALKRLAREGLVRPVDGQEQEPLEDARGERTVYEATAEGVRHFRAWIRSSIALPPAREDLLAKIALCTPADLPRMIEVVQEAEQSCTTRLLCLNRRTRRERAKLGPREWKRRMGVAASASEATWWEGRIAWLQKLRADLKIELRHHEAERRSARAPGPG